MNGSFPSVSLCVVFTSKINLKNLKKQSIPCLNLSSGLTAYQKKKFMIALKNWNNLTKEVKDTHTKTCSIDEGNEKMIQMQQYPIIMDRKDIIKMTIVSKAIYKFNAI